MGSGAQERGEALEKLAHIAVPGSGHKGGGNGEKPGGCRYSDRDDSRVKQETGLYLKGLFQGLHATTAEQDPRPSA